MNGHDAFLASEVSKGERIQAYKQGAKIFGQAYHGVVGEIGGALGEGGASAALKTAGKGHVRTARVMGRVAGQGISHPHRTGYATIFGPSAGMLGAAGAADARERLKKSHEVFISKGILGDLTGAVKGVGMGAKVASAAPRIGRVVRANPVKSTLGAGAGGLAAGRMMPRKNTNQY